MDNLKDDFHRDGFAVLPQFYSDEEIDGVVESISQRKLQRPLNVTIELLDTGERTILGLLSAQEIATRRMKINDLYLDMPEVRHLALSDRLTPILRHLLGQDPALCNSLYLDKGSAQPAHVDSLYMTPRTPLHLIATWVALEDAHPDAGQLEYYPGSHKIEQMIFSNGRYHHVLDEMAKWHEYMEAQVKNAGLRKVTFAAKKGDVFAWHANLLHGGGPITDMQRTRKSLVFHYFSLVDAQGQDMKLEPLAGAHWINRSIQALPASSLERALREPAFLETFEKIYLEKYPDVAQGVRDGAFTSGMHHYEVHGRKEGRGI